MLPSRFKHLIHLTVARVWRIVYQHISNPHRIGKTGKSRRAETERFGNTDSWRELHIYKKQHFQITWYHSNKKRTIGKKIVKIFYPFIKCFRLYISPSQNLTFPSRQIHHWRCLAKVTLLPVRPTSSGSLSIKVKKFEKQIWRRFSANLPRPGESGKDCICRRKWGEISWLGEWTKTTHVIHPYQGFLFLFYFRYATWNVASTT